MPFLLDKSCKINLKDGTITRNEQEFVPNERYLSEGFGKILFTKTEINTLVDRTHQIKELISEVNQRNPKGNIVTTKHAIQLKKDQEGKRKQYTIPLKIKSEPKVSLKRPPRKKNNIEIYIKLCNAGILHGKEEWQLRPILDYRCLNCCAISQKPPIPKIQNHLFQKEASQYLVSSIFKAATIKFTWKIMTKFKTAFVITNKTFLSKRMPIGLVSVPATFQKTIIDLLGHLSFIKIYLDDILVHSKSTNEHLGHLKTVLSIIRTN